MSQLKRLTQLHGSFSLLVFDLSLGKHHSLIQIMVQTKITYFTFIGGIASCYSLFSYEAQKLLSEEFPSVKHMSDLEKYMSDMQHIKNR